MAYLEKNEILTLWTMGHVDQNPHDLEQEHLKVIFVVFEKDDMNAYTQENPR